MQQPDLFTVKEVEWGFTTDEVESVKIANAGRSLNLHDGRSALLDAGVWGLFKRDFPEHCIDIVENVLDDDFELDKLLDMLQ